MLSKLHVLLVPFIFIGLLLIAGCKLPNPSNGNLLHVTSATDICEKSIVTGDFNGKHYRLTPVSTDSFGFVACWGAINTTDVGKNYQARLEDGYLVIDDPLPPGTTLNEMITARRKMVAENPALHLEKSYLIENPDKFRYKILAVSE